MKFQNGVNLYLIKSLYVFLDYLQSDNDSLIHDKGMKKVKAYYKERLAYSEKLNKKKEYYSLVRRKFFLFLSGPVNPSFEKRKESYDKVCALIQDEIDLLNSFSEIIKKDDLADIVNNLTVIRNTIVNSACPEAVIETEMEETENDLLLVSEELVILRDMIQMINDKAYLSFTNKAKFLLNKAISRMQSAPEMESSVV